MLHAAKYQERPGRQDFCDKSAVAGTAAFPADLTGRIAGIILDPAEAGGICLFALHLDALALLKGLVSVREKFLPAHGDSNE